MDANRKERMSKVIVELAKEVLALPDCKCPYCQGYVSSLMVAMTAMHVRIAEEEKQSPGKQAPGKEHLS